METADALTRLIFGGAPLGGLYSAVSEHDARAALETAWASGFRAFDTAPLYGFGLSERRLGAFLAGKPRDAYRVSTKVGRVLVPSQGCESASKSLGTFAGTPPLDAVFDFSADGIARSFESSLERLGLQYVDVAFVHDPDDDMDRAIGEAWPALRCLKDRGLVRAIGVGANGCPPLLRFVRECAPDVVMVAGRYTLLDRSAADELLPLCEERGVRVIAAGVFNSGILASPTDDARFFYQRADDATLARARRIATICERDGVALPAVALAFALRNPAIAQVALGMRSPDEVRANAAYARAHVPDALWRELAREEAIP